MFIEKNPMHSYGHWGKFFNDESWFNIATTSGNLNPDNFDYIRYHDAYGEKWGCLYYVPNSY